MKKFKFISFLFIMIMSLGILCSCGGEQGPVGPQGEKGETGEKGDTGAQGQPGNDGVSITEIKLTSSEENVDTYTIYYSDGTTSYFKVTNGKDGAQGIQGIQGEKGEDGHTPVITIQNGYWYIDGLNTNVLAEGLKGDTGNGISSITLTSSEGLVDTYTITFTNGEKTTFTVTNGKDGAQGIQGIQGIPGENGHTPVITIQNGNWYIDGEDTNVLAQGIKGDTGNGISSITLTSSEGLVDTYTITFTNGEKTTFTVTNGKDGAQGIQGIQGIPGQDGHTPVITIVDGYWYIDGVSTTQIAQGLKGDTGNGISSITLTSSKGLVDIYTITFTNGEKTTFTVTNGKDGAQGIQGIQGIPGENGHTPVITIQNGNWYIDGEDTNVLAQGIKGDTGNGISSIVLTSSVGLIDTYTITYTNGEIFTFTIKNGEQGISPDFKIEEGFVFISYDKGESWKQIGDLNTYESEFNYVILDDTTATITGYKGDSKDVVVPDKITDEGIEYTVVAIESGAFYFRSDLTSITLPNTLQTIGDYAFYYCCNIKELIIPDSVTYIGLDALAGCYRLESITIPFVGSSIDSNETFGYLFGTNYYSYSTKVDQGEKYYIPNSLINVNVSGNKVNDKAFKNIKSLQNITIDETVKNIGSYSFYGCENIKEIVIPSSVEIISSYAFQKCSNLESINIGNGLTKIEVCAFADCTSIKELVIPNSVQEIGSSIFSGCTQLENLTIPFVGDKNGSTNTFVYIFGSISNIPTTLTEVTVKSSNIPEEAFKSCSSIKTIKLENVVDLPRWSLAYCSGLENIYLPSTLKTVDEYVFSLNENLTNVYYSGSIEDWCNINFYDYDENPMYFANNFYLLNEINEWFLLTNLIIPNTVTTINKYQFSGFNNLTSVEISSSVISIDEGAFTGCGNIEYMILPFVGEKYTTSVDNYQKPFGYIFGTFNYDGAIKISQMIYAPYSGTTYNTAYIPSKLNTIYVTGGTINYGAFDGCANLVKIVLDESITQLGSFAFRNCTSLVEINIPKNVNSIGQYAFSNCSSLTDIELPNLISNITYGTFNNCSSLKEIHFPESVKTYELNILSGCSSLEKITISNLNTTIGQLFGTSYYANSVATKQYYSTSSYSTYYIPTNLTEVTILNGKIPYGAFYNCNMITSITLSKNISSIADYAFYNCTGLEKVYYSGTMEDWCNISFNSNTQNPMYYAEHLYMLDENNEWYEVTDITIPESISVIKKYQFYGFDNVTTVNLHEGVTSIEPGAFEKCSNLEFINFPTSLENISSNAFYSCNNLINLDFTNCTASIGENAFSMCNNLQNIYIGTSIINITSSQSFNSPIVNIYYNGTIEDWCLLDFENNYKNPMNFAEHFFMLNENNEWIELIDLVIPDTITKIGTCQFYGFKNIKKVIINSNVTTIERYAFDKCSNLSYVDLGNSVTEISDYSFSYCTSLNYMIIPNSITEFMTYTFSQSNKTGIIYFKGTDKQWSSISKSGSSGNQFLINSTVYYYSEEEPTNEGNYWYYVDEEVVVWTLE